MSRARILSFLTDFEKRATAEQDLASVDSDYDDLPAVRGGYILMAKGRTIWRYPWGKSPVFYIGKSGRSIRERLWEHWDGARRAKRYTADSLSEAIYQYVAELPTRYVMVPTWRGMTPDSIEKELFAKFVQDYGARPIANGQMRWSRT